MFPYQKYKASPNGITSKPVVVPVPAPAAVVAPVVVEHKAEVTLAKSKKTRHTVSESVDESIVQDGRSNNTLSD